MRLLLELRWDNPLADKCQKKDRLELIKIATIFVSIAIIAWVTATMLVPRIINPSPSSILLNKTVTLTEANYEVGYPLALRKSERIDVKASGNGQPIDFRITDNGSSTLAQKGGDTFYDLPLTIPADGTYTFYVSATEGDVRATVIVAKTSFFPTYRSLSR